MADNFPTAPAATNPDGSFHLPDATNAPQKFPLPAAGPPPSPITPQRPSLAYAPPGQLPQGAPMPNQYGQAPVNPFAGAGPTAPSFAGQGVPNYPPTMKIPGQAPPAPPVPMGQYTDPTKTYAGADVSGKINSPGQTPVGVGAIPGGQYTPPPATASVPINQPPAALPSAPAQPSVTGAMPYLPPSQPLGQGAGGTYVPPTSRYNGSTLGQPITSDIRAKTNIVPGTPEQQKVLGLRGDSSALDDAYARAARDTGSRFAVPEPQVDLRPAQGYTYDYKDPTAPGAAPGRQYGPMAQDLEKTPAAGAVSTGPDGKKQVDTGRLAMVNTAAISEQQKRIDTLTDYIKSHMGAAAEKDTSLPPDWKYSPTDWSTSDATAKTNIEKYPNSGGITDSGITDDDIAKAPDTTGKVNDDSKKKKGPNWDFINKAVGAYRNAVSQPVQQFSAPGVASPYASSDVKAKTNIQPSTMQAAMRSAPAPIAPAAATPYPAEPVGTRERALAAGYAWLAAHGDQGAARHEAPAAPLPAEAQQAAGRQMGEQIPVPQPTGMEAMQSSQFPLPSQDEADMAAIQQEVEARRRAMGR